MPDFVLELYSEDIPARMQTSAARALARRVNDGLAGADVSGAVPESFATPRRLALIIRDLPDSQPARTSERKGPRTNAPDKAIQGFLRSTGVQSVSDLGTRNDGKGDFYVAVKREEARPLSALLTEIVPDALHDFPWPKSMRWGGGTFRWVRPLRSILCLFDGKVVDFGKVVGTVPGVGSGNTTQGHPVMAPKMITISGAQDYLKKMEEARVILGEDRRVKFIRDWLRAVASKHECVFVEDETLIAETAGQVEWPVILPGILDKEFIDLPEEILLSVMRTHQQNFVFRDQKTKHLAPWFAMIADVNASDGGKAIVAGNEAVLRARLADARFHWNADCRKSLEEHREKADKIVLHGRLGTLGDKTQRLEKMCEYMTMDKSYGQIVKENLKFLKSDLATGTVQEFPELQGVIGYHLALKNKDFSEKESQIVSGIIKEQYAPTGQDDAIPSTEAGQWVAFMDKVDTLASFFLIGEEPSGSGDPHGLRRAALGVIRILLEGKINPKLLSQEGVMPVAYPLSDIFFDFMKNINEQIEIKDGVSIWNFIEERLKVYLRSNYGMPHDVIDAVLSPSGVGQGGGIDYPRRSALLVKTLAEFLNTDDGANLLAGYKRAANILRIEQEKEGEPNKYTLPPDRDLFRKEAEKTLANALKIAEKRVHTNDFVAAMTALAELRQPLDAFFDSVTVNDSDKALRANRLKLLSQVRKVMHRVADFSRIEGGERKQS